MDFWKNKKILVTDEKGFLGSHLVEKLKQLGCENIFVPLREEYNLVNMERIKRLLPTRKTRHCNSFGKDFPTGGERKIGYPKYRTNPNF